jgi:hypothetical protein
MLFTRSTCPDQRIVDRSLSAYADNTERLATAFDSRYARLTHTQRQAADTLFRQHASAPARPRSRR